MISFMTLEDRIKNKDRIDKSLLDVKRLIKLYIRYKDKDLNKAKRDLRRAKLEKRKTINIWRDKYKLEKSKHDYIVKSVIPKCEMILKSIDNNNYEVNADDSTNNDIVLYFPFINFSADYIDNKLSIHVWTKENGCAILKTTIIGDK